eukprot:CAMPEP_0201908122 /NCGR_PEP_ID=MMETSP0903-20130614/323_1 /ASSEMBLY_ACC=CAM_ASM_000552 /TAXON_ID=420261 /ORGANISM="Thalassiosira antarctica, Strain CCMP982" /LENGTH=424 /DNA_ID=CAMNT_0048442391 /DNA_START=63 /DNA_END=1334 /DNA_ORIENTATION=-
MNNGHKNKRKEPSPRTEPECNMQHMELPKGIFLAPMVRGSELAFRMLARRCGNACLCYSPMLRDHDVISVAASLEQFLSDDFELKIDGAGRACSIEESAHLMLRDAHRSDTANLMVQLCGSCPVKLAQATTAVLDIYSSNNGILPSGVDLNLGCPQECAAKDGFGAFLAENDASTAIECIASMKNAIDNYPRYKKTIGNKPRLSAKIRLLGSGVDGTIEFIRKLQTAGVAFVVVHCRRRTDKHDGNADWDSGGKIVAAFPSGFIILNGGISDYNDAMQVMERTKCHAVMAATGYLRNHRRYVAPSKTTPSLEPQHVAMEYLELAESFPPPSYLYIQKHMRWIFRDILQPENDPSFDRLDYSAWRVRLLTFLESRNLRSTEQFRLFVALYVQLSECEPPKSIRDLVKDVSFGSVKKAGKRKRGAG